ncbi:hypothetical protein LEP3755_63900 (plasmid) [Leptolyngbya sp. NIES-3755]|nr:hypothetical protein LEP3755_63900 [Leptolyngbya sp. NIES-3755]
MLASFINKKLVVSSLVLLSTVTLISCGSNNNSATANQDRVQTPAQTTTPAQGGTTQSREVDRMFLEMMVPHHQSANEMARIELQKGKNPEVKKLAQKIIDEQTREIQQMQTYYKQWYGTELPTMKTSGNMGNMQMSSQMGESMMMSMRQQDNMNQEMLNTLKNSPNVDQEFLRQMTRHHQMATMMAGMVVDSATHPETRKLAQSIVKSQNEEIAQMQQLLRQASAR